MTIYNLPRKFNIFSCSCHTGPLVEFPVQPPHQEDLNLPTFVKIGEPTDEVFFYNLEGGCEQNGDKYLNNLNILNHKHWHTYYGTV